MAADGFTKVPNKIMDALCFTQLSGKESRLLRLIMRKTWGFQKESDRISYKQLEKGTGIHRRDCHKVMKRLIERKIVGKNSNAFFVNPITQQWRGPLAKTLTLVKTPQVVGENPNENVGEISAHKRKKKLSKERGKPKRNCETCGKEFWPAREFYTKCDNCFASTGKQSPNPASRWPQCPMCGPSTNCLRVVEGVGCNMCKPYEVD